DVAAADPTGINKDGELIRIEAECPACGLGICFFDLTEFRMHRHPRYLDLLRRDTVIDQLPPRFVICDQIKGNFVACPTLPETITRIGNDRNERNLLGKL